MRRLGACVLALLVAGCATTLPPDVARAWPERRAELQALEQWQCEGRIALAAGEEGFSGALDWRQRGREAEITLRGPMGGDAILIHVDGTAYEVTDRSGTRYGGEDARRFLEQSLGPEAPLPISEMRYWLVGAPAPGVPHSETLDANERLAGLDQSGWRVRYDRYAPVGELALPRRIEMTAGDMRLRVVVANWRFGS